MSLVKFGNAYVCIGGGYTTCDPPPAPPEPPTSNYFQFTNKGSSTATLTITSGSSGRIFVNDEFIDKFSSNTPIEVEVPRGGVVKVTGLTSRGSGPLYNAVTSDNTENYITIDRFDESASSCNSLFVNSVGIKEVTSWNGAQNITSLEYTFSQCDLTKIPSSWAGLESIVSLKNAFANSDLSSIPSTWDVSSTLTTMTRTFYGCQELTAIPESWSGLESVTQMDVTFNMCTELVSGGNEDFEGLSGLTVSYGMFSNDRKWTGDAEGLYDYLSTKNVEVTNHENTFTECFDAIGHENVLDSWGGLYAPDSWTEVYLETSRYLYVSTKLTPKIFYDSGSGWERIKPGIKKLISVTSEVVCKVANAYELSSGYGPVVSAADGSIMHIKKFDTKITKLTNMFGGGTYYSANDSMPPIYPYALTSYKIKIDSWDGLEHCTNLGGAFFNSDVVQLPNDWTPLSNVEVLCHAFAGCTNLTSISSNNFDKLTKLTDVRACFCKCQSWNEDCTQIYNFIKSLNLDWIKHGGVFNGCRSLVNWNSIAPEYGGPLTNYVSFNNTLRQGSNSTLYFNSTPAVTCRSGRYGSELENGGLYNISGTYTNINFVGWDGGATLYVQYLNKSSSTSSLFFVNSGRGIITKFDPTWTDISYMFTMEILEIASWEDAENVSNCDHAFSGNNKLTKIATPTSAFTNAQDTVNVNYMFSGCRNVESGILAMYNYLSSLPNIGTHTACFRNCGSNTTTGAAELAQIPSDWK